MESQAFQLREIKWQHDEEKFLVKDFILSQNQQFIAISGIEGLFLYYFKSAKLVKQFRRKQSFSYIHPTFSVDCKYLAIQESESDENINETDMILIYNLNDLRLDEPISDFHAINYVQNFLFLTNTSLIILAKNIYFYNFMEQQVKQITLDKNLKNLTLSKQAKFYTLQLRMQQLNLLYIYNTKTQQKLNTIQEYPKLIEFDKNDSLILTHNNNYIKITCLQTLKLLRKIQVNQSIQLGRLNKDGIFAYYSNQIAFLNIQTGKKNEEHQNEVAKNLYLYQGMLNEKLNLFINKFIIIYLYLLLFNGHYINL